MTEALQFSRPSLRVAIDNDRDRSFFRERPCCRGPDSLGATGDDYDLIAQLQVHD
jgi:hypothetical protein